MKGKVILLVDAMNLFYRAFHAYKRLSHNDESVSAIYGMPTMLGDYIFRFRPDEVMVVWDGDRSEMRKDLLPSYKEGRNKDRLIDWDNLELQKKVVRKIFHSLGVKQILNKDAEADDMIYKMTYLALKKLNRYSVVIVSSDKDYNQLLVEDRVTIWNDSKKDLIHTGNVKKYFGYTAEQTVDYLTLVGDSSDNIPGYPGIGEKKAPEFLEEFGSISNFLSQKSNTFRGIDRIKLKEVVKRNYMLIDLAIFYEVNKDTLKTVFYKESNPKFDYKEFKKLCQEWNLRKFLIPSFHQHYKNLSA